MNCFSEAQPVVANTIFRGDSASVGPEISLGSAGQPSNLFISYSDVEGGQSLVNVDSGCELHWLSGMIDAGPMFVDPDSADYGLQPGSPCIDTGDPLSENIPWGGWRRDMGAYEYDQDFYYNGDVLIRRPVEVEPHHMTVR